VDRLDELVRSGAGGASPARDLVEEDREGERVLAWRAEHVAGERDRVIERAGLGAHRAMRAQITKALVERAVDATNRELRDELVAEAVERALHDGGQAMAAVAESPDDPLAAVIDAYLSVAHRDGLGTSCAVTTLATDVARSNPRARAAYTSQVGVYIEMLVRLLPPGPSDRRRATAITALSTLVGAVSMARAVSDEALSQEILASAALELKSQLR